MDQIADAMDIEDDPVLAEGIDGALELADHGWLSGAMIWRAGK
jgi:hypothetical protein